MKAAPLAAALLLAASLAGPSASAMETFDNPTLGSAPCVVFNRYEVNRHGGDDPKFSARAEIENICGRTLEVTFCFILAESVDGSDRHCVDSMLRPWSGEAVAYSGAPARITGPEYHWRYLPVR